MSVTQKSTPAAISYREVERDLHTPAAIPLLRGKGVDFPDAPKWIQDTLFPYWRLPKNTDLKDRARSLRNNSTLSEVLFWQTCKQQGAIGWDIDRQIIIGNYIVDFFIPELGLIFEIDGESHLEKELYDQKREQFLASLGLHVVHIDDLAVKNNMSGVYEQVIAALNARIDLLLVHPPLTPQEGNTNSRFAQNASL